MLAISAAEIKLVDSLHGSAHYITNVGENIKTYHSEGANFHHQEPIPGSL